MPAASCSLRLVQRASSRSLATQSANVGLRFNSQIHAQTSQAPQQSKHTHPQKPDLLPTKTSTLRTRTVRVDGLSLKPDPAGYKKIATAFKGYGRIRDVRIVDGVAYVDFLHNKDAEYVLDEHQAQPFTAEGGEALNLAPAPPDDVPVDDVRMTLRVCGVSVNDPSVRRGLAKVIGEKWAIKLNSSVMDNGIDQPLGYVSFSTPLDARIAHEYFSTKFPQASALYVDKIRDDEAFPPNHTLSIVGFKGNKYEFRRFFHEFRHEIQDVRRTAKFTATDSWEFVFVKFSSIDVAWRVKAMLEEKHSDAFRVRFSGA